MATKMSKKKRIKARKPLSRKAPQKKRSLPKKATPKKGRAVRKRNKVQRKGRNVELAALNPEELNSRPNVQSGDLQGLSNTPGADSESVDELLEEGNALEAEAVKGVEDAPDADEGEVRTHEVPEDDVPEEYDEQ
jgi:hypothetical protein